MNTIHRYIYAKICKEEIVINLIKREYYDDDYFETNAIKLNIKDDSEKNPEYSLYSKLRFFIESELQTDIMNLLKTYHNLNNGSIKSKVIEIRNLRLKELEGLDTRKPNIHFNDVVDAYLFDSVYDIFEI